MKEHYRPLPDTLTIKDSKIEGLGLHATSVIKKGTYLGVSHVFSPEEVNGYIRTPLGGFINHSDDPNCKTVEDYGVMSLITIKGISPGEELTLKYHLYSLFDNIR
jgi:SET domain-containing protein